MVVRQCCASVCVCTFMLLSGCGSSGPERVNVTGTVTFKGEPIENGAIEFIPTGGGPMQPVTVTAGKFSAKGEQGVIVGEYKLVFHAYNLKASKNPEQDGAMIPEMMSRSEQLPKQFSTEACKETASLKKGMGSADLKFDLK